MRKKAIATILVLVTAAAVGTFYVYPMLNPVRVDASRADRGNLYVTVKAPGQVVPKELVPVLAPAPAKVVSIAVTLGQEVKKGDVLMDIEVVSTGQGLGPSASPSTPPSRLPPATGSPIAPTPAPTFPSNPEGTRPPTQAPKTPQSQPSPGPSPSPAPTQLPSPTSRPEGTQPAPSPSSAPTQPAPSPRPEGTEPPPPSATPSPAPSGSYTIQPGDTLSGIAAQNGTTVEAIAQANGISNPDLIYPGQQLTIPQGQGGFLAAPPLEKAKIVSSITSPIDGQVVKLEVRADELVAPQSALVVLADMTSLYLEIMVDQEDLPEISKGKSAQTVLDALPKETVKGKVEEINLMPVTGPLGTSGYPVKVGLEAPPKGIRLGMTGQAEIVTKQLTNVLFVPKRAVLERKGEVHLFVVEGDRAQKTIVTVGQKTRDYYEITSGLTEGQLVVVTKLDEMDDGRRVAVDKVLGPK